MSEKTSLSSEGLNRSLVDLSLFDPKATWFDVDELFSSNRIRRKLAKKLSEPQPLKAPSTLEGELSEGTSKLKHIGLESPPLSDDFMSPERYSNIKVDEGESIEGDSQKSELTEEQEASAAGISGKPSGPSELDFVPWRVFLNCVDTFSMKYIANFLSERIQGSSKSEEIEEGGEEEMEEESEMFGEEEEETFKKPKEEPKPEMNYEIFGSLLEQNGEYDKEVISKIVETADLVQLLKILKTCGFIIYDISRYPNQVREARWVCQTLLYELQLLEKNHPETFSNLTQIPVFILISSFMTWAKTKGPGPHSENHYKKRRSHSNYADHLQLEKEVMAAGKVYPSKYKTLVLCSGLQYGHEEDMLNFLFRLAWENEPELPLYSPPKNCIPLVHVEDLAAMVFNILENSPKKRYIFAVEQGASTIKGITKAISKCLSSGEIMTLPNENMKLLKLPQTVIDCLSSNIRMEPTFFAEPERINWKYETPFTANITNIVKEYLKSRNLGPKGILIIGPPASGKTILAIKLARYYQLHYITPTYVADRTMKTLEEKIKRMEAKEAAALEKERLRAEAEEEEEEEEIEEEEEEEEGEGEKETVESLKEILMELQQNIIANEGLFDEEHLLRCIRPLLVSFPVRNQGYVVDGFINTVREVKKVYKAPVEGEEEEEVVEEEDEEVEDGAPYPDYVIGIEASDDFLYKRVMAMPQEEIETRGYDEETYKELLTTYRKENTDEIGLLSYFDEREIHPVLIAVDKDDSPNFEDTFQHVKKNLGEPQNFGLNTVQLELKAKLEKELARITGDQEQKRKEQAERTTHEERMRKIEQWAVVMDALRQEEEEIIEADNLPLRHYLMRYVFPRLTNGLVELERLRPNDPLDFLAEFLFKENPEGKLIEPEYTKASRKFFQDLLKCRETLFSLTTLDKEQEEMFFPKDVLENQDQEFDTFF